VTRPQSRGETVAATAALALLLFLVLPGTLYLGNVHEFMTAPAPIAGVLLIPTLLSVLAIMVVLRFGRRADFSRLSSVTAGITLLAWIEAYLLVWDYGVLNGSPIDWEASAWRGWIDLPMWIGGLGLAAAFHRRLARPLASAAFAVVALQTAVLVFDGVSRREQLAAKPSRHATTNELGAMARFSAERNVLHLILDGFQADIFKDIVEGPARAYFRPALSGFTFFEENLGTYPATYLALPAIVSGQEFYNHKPRPAFIEDAFGGASILNAAHAAGFEVDLSSEAMMLDMLMLGRFDNAYLISRPSHAEDAARLVDLALLRAVPHLLKPRIYNRQRWLVQRLAGKTELMGFHYFSHNSFLAEVTRRFAADRDRPVYKFFHLLGTHMPFVVNPDCSYAGGAIAGTRETVTAQSQCSLAFVVALLDRMKAAGIYDSSLIVIMGDHGASITPRRFQPGSIVEGTSEYPLEPWFLGLATPLLAIKPPGATGPLQVSSTLTSNTDVAATINALLGLGAALPGRSVFDPARDPTVERCFYGYQWDPRDPISDYIGTIQQYRVSGTAYRSESWRIGSTHPTPQSGRNE